jgi:paraquat-inducible protein A
MTSARDAGYMLCHCCNKLLQAEETAEEHLGTFCPRCGAEVHARKPHSLARSWAFTIAATICLVPANTFPILTTTHLGRGEPSTIMSGVGTLLHEGLYGIAFLIFVASVAVPVVKLFGMLYLLLSIHFGWKSSPIQRTAAFRFIEFIGRWSMLDIFVISILVAVVKFERLATISAGFGATAFGAVVVLTMLAAHSFDPRLIWDKMKVTQ